MENPFISVVVPIYKAESYIDCCIACLQNQTLCNFEVILVDDGSPDKSGVKCDEVVHRDHRFKVIHKENGGVASARQTGFEMAKGEYVIHVDPDDWIEPNMLMDLYNYAHETDADMVICDYYEHNKDGERHIKQQPKSCNPRNIVFDMLDGTLHGACWNKLVRRSAIVENGVSFPTLSLCEDTYFNAALLMNSIKVSYLNKAYYHYERTNTNSVTRAGNPCSGLYAYQACAAFRKLLVAHSDEWDYFVKHEMPWMAYLSLYYNNLSPTKFQKEYRELLMLKSKTLNDKIVRLALKCYLAGLSVVCLRKCWRMMHKGKSV